MSAGTKNDPWQELEEKVGFLKRPDAYAEKTAGVEFVETHMSCVFLTENHVYKLKKPARLPFLDFSTLEARRRSVETELRLNARLAPGVYLEVLPLVRTGQGRLHLGAVPGQAEILDWLLKMKRLPRASMLDQAMQRPGFSHAEVAEAARLLAGYYRQAARTPIASGDYCSRLAGRVRQNQEVLASPGYGLDRRLVEDIHRRQDAWLERHSGLVAERARQGRIVDGHGDLRPEHICLGDPPLVIDRLEAAPQERSVDPVDELCLLQVECRLLDHPEVGEIFLRVYREDGADPYPVELPPFFRSLRACTRARFSAWHLDDPQVRDKDKWRAKARAYLELGRLDGPGQFLHH